MISRPCLNCREKPLMHTARYMLCPGFLTQYEPDPDLAGRIPDAKPEPYEAGLRS